MYREERSRSREMYRNQFSMMNSNNNNKYDISPSYFLDIQLGSATKNRNGMNFSFERLTLQSHHKSNIKIEDDYEQDFISTGRGISPFKDIDDMFSSSLKNKAHED